MLEARDQLTARLRERDVSPSEHSDRLHAHDVWKHDLADRSNGTIDPWYQCDLYTEMIAYAVNYTFPWCTFPFLPILFGSSF